MVFKFLFATLLGLSLSSYTVARNCSCLDFYIGAEGGYEKLFNLPEYSFGFVGLLDQPPSSVLLNAKDKPSGTYFAPFAGVNIPFNSCCLLLPDALNIEVSGNFFFAKERDNIFFAAPGFVALAFAPNFTNTLALPIDGPFERRYKYDTGRIDIAPSYCFNIGCYPISIAPILSYADSRFVESYDFFAFLDNIDSFVSLKQKLTTFYHDLGGGLGVGFSGCKNFDFFAKAIIYHTWADSHIQNSITTGPSVILQRFGPNLSQSDNSYTFRGTLGLGVHFCRIYFGVIGRYEYRHYVPGIFNPVVTIIGEPALNEISLTKNHSFWSASIGGYGGLTF